MSKELHHFNVHGLTESIRYILHYTKQKYEDIKHDDVDWPDQDVKESTEIGHVPLYKEGDRSLHHWLAVAKYVARDTDLIPKDPWKQAFLESIVYSIYDLWKKIEEYIKEKDLDKKHALKEKLLEETIDLFFVRFEKYLKENGGFFSGKLSWVEFILCGLVETSDIFLGIQIEKEYPLVAAVVKKIRNLPGVKEHIATRGPLEAVYKRLESYKNNL
ncbi:glutathione S-transferase-like [Anticarsia gemmatalis]|uniref:glutathione S-transferase-like n=1 Tax=Anticarsia gemmatalis TaxID=129554 RepID=UPI003F76F829